MVRTDDEERAVRGTDAAGQDLNEEANDSVIGWLALYLPSWGTSLLMHAAVLLLVAFFSAMPAGAGAVPFKYYSGVVEVPRHVIEKKGTPSEKARQSRSKRPGEGGEASRGLKTPEISGLLRQFTTNPIPDVASNNLNEVQVIGFTAGGKELGGFEGSGPGSGRGTGDGTGGFWNVPLTPIGWEGDARKIVYVVDRSGSMTDSIDYVKMELKRSLRDLNPDKQFDIIFYSSGPALEMPARRLVTAVQVNKDQAFEFIDGIVAQGETDPAEALQRAFAVKPDVIFFLTDGEFDKSIVEQVRRANVGKKVIVNTIAFLYRDGEPLLRQIAADNGGNYKFVAETDLER